MSGLYSACPDLWVSFFLFVWLSLVYLVMLEGFTYLWKAKRSLLVAVWYLTADLILLLSPLGTEEV